MDWQKAFSNLKILNWLVLLGLASVSFMLMPESFTMGIILGGLLIILNFHFFQKTIRNGFAQDGTFRAKKAVIIGKCYLRLAVMGIIIYLLVSREWIHPVGLVIGLSVIVLSILCLGIIRIWKPSSREAI